MADIDEQVAAATLTTRAPKMGHRKIAATSMTFAGGASIGVPLLLWFWSAVVDGVAAYGVNLPYMPESIAQNLLSLVMLFVFYRTKEDLT